MEDEYPSNSKIVKRGVQGAAPSESAAPRQVQRVTTGPVRRRHKGLFRKAREAFVGDDTKGVSEYIVVDILIPSMKRMVEESITQGVSRKLWGGNAGGMANPMFRQPMAWTNYQQPSTLRQVGAGLPPTGALTKQQRATHRFDEIVFAARVDAEAVLSQLIGLVSEFGLASVRDFYDSVGEDPEYTDERYGWRDLSGAEVRPARGGGYSVILPRPEPLS